MSRVIAAGVIAFILATPEAFAQQAANPEGIATPKIIQDIEKCRAITSAEARLACFDATTAGLAGAIESKEVLVVEQEEVKKTKRSLFGFRLPDLSIFGSEEEKPEDQQLETTIVKATLGPTGRWNITTAEGAVWQTTESVVFPPRTGDPLQIKKGALGSYFLKVKGRRPVRTIRIQ